MRIQYKNRVPVFTLGAFGLLAIATLAVQGNVKQQRVHVDHVITAHGDSIIFTNLSDLEQRSDIIAVVRPLNSFEEREYVVTRHQDGMIQEFYTKTKLKIEKVYKDTYNATASSDVLYANEHVGLIDEKGKKVKLKFEGYNELEKNKRYIVFLQKNDVGEYFLINLNNGKIVYDKKEEKQADIEDLDEAGLKLRDEVRGKYKL